MIDPTESSSTRPYLIRALYEWCSDNGLTPFLAVLVDASVRVPNEYVKDGEIVLNISFDATSALSLGNDLIEFKGRFGGIARDIVVPVSQVLAIYAKENGQGMAFPMLNTPSGIKSSSTLVESKSTSLTRVTTEGDDYDPNRPRPKGGAKPALTRVK